MDSTMAPPKPAFLSGDQSSLRSFGGTSGKSSSSRMSLKAGTAFVLSRLVRPSRSESKMRNVDAVVAQPSRETTSKPQTSLKSKNILRRISTTFTRKSTTSSAPPPPVPPLPVQPSSASKSSAVNDGRQGELSASAATQVKQNWVETHRDAESKQRERLCSFKFGGLSPRASSEFLESPETEAPVPAVQPSPRKRVPSALKLGRARPLGPSTPPPNRALPPSPSDPDYEAYISHISVQRDAAIIDGQSLSPFASHFPPSPVISDFSVSPPTPSDTLQTSISEESSFVRTPSDSSHNGAHIASNSPRHPKMFKSSSSLKQLDDRQPVNPRIYTPGDIAAATSAIDDPESRRLTEIAFLY
ncbi:hypothetical protein C8J56DRAFT_486270 [Mycena floridula]|nr:hypothetical protein C8J56DRAFT_486270 [Mycena floridula]